MASKIKEVANVVMIILRKCHQLDYVVTGGRSYIAHIPNNSLKILAMILPKHQVPYFDNTMGDWNVLANKPENHTKIVNEIKKELFKRRIEYTIRQDTEPVTRSVFILQENKKDILEFAYIVDVQKTNKANIPCYSGNNNIKIVKGVKFASIVDVLSGLKMALESETFEKKDKNYMRLFMIMKTCKIVKNTRVRELLAILTPMVMNKVDIRFTLSAGNIVENIASNENELMFGTIGDVNKIIGKNIDENQLNTDKN